MHIFFLHTNGHGYDPQTPLRQPLGGTESAVAYLSAALARQGVQVSLVNNAPEERVVDGVRLLPNGSRAGIAMREADMVVAVAVATGRRLRALIGQDVPLVLWCHLAADQEYAAPLGLQQERDAWSALVMVSQWQLNSYADAFHVSRDKSLVIGNAIAPFFAKTEPQPAWFETGEAPTLIYTSTPFRGLDILLMSYAAIRARVPDVRLKVFSGMKLYGGNGPDAFSHLYELARVLPGAEYRGVIPQSELAVELAGAAALSYPSTFAETSCIAAMEAMSLGAEPITTDLGALPETLSGFGRTIPFASGELGMLHGFVDAVVNALDEARQNPAAAAERRARQIAFVRQNYIWDSRATRWIALAENFMRARKDGIAAGLWN